MAKFSSTTNDDNERANRNFSVIGIAILASAAIGFLFGAFSALIILT